MTSVQAWQVRKVWFSFREDPNKGKYRPVVVKEVAEDNCVVIYVTSKVHKSNYSDFLLLQDWQQEGVTCASAVRIRKTLRIPVDALGEYLGELSPRDRLEIQMKYSF